MTLADKILFIAQHEWPDRTHRLDGNAVMYRIGTFGVGAFEPLESWEHLMPLVIKYHIHIEPDWFKKERDGFIEDKLCWYAWFDHDKFIMSNGANESEYRRVAIEAIYEIIKQEVES